MTHEPPANPSDLASEAMSPSPIASLCDGLREDPSGPDVGTLYWLLAEMCWPDAPAKSEAFFGTYFAAVIDHAMRTLSFKDSGSSPGEPGGLETFHELVQSLTGGWQTWVNLSRPGGVLEDFRNRMKQGRRAGAILGLLYVLHTEHAKDVKDISQNKVCAFLAAAGDGLLGFHSAYDTLKDAWDECKPAAHLWGGLFFAEQAMPRQTVAVIAQTDTAPGALLDHLALEPLGRIARPTGRVMLSMAAELQAFGRDLTPPRVLKKKRVLDLEPHWILTDLPDWGTAYHPRIRLTDEQLALFRATPVPKRKRRPVGTAKSKATDL
jgi:hypothetical protein